MQIPEGVEELQGSGMLSGEDHAAPTLQPCRGREQGPWAMGNGPWAWPS